MSHTWDILGLGCVAVDDLLYLDAFPQPDTKMRVRARERQCGGLSANALVAAARLGARCAHAGTLGPDAGAAVFGDLERDEWPGFEELFGLVDHLVVNHAFACKRSGCADPATAAERLLRTGKAAVVVTCGAAGCWWVGEGAAAPVYQPAFPVAVVDTTGCGDVFHGAYAAAWVRGLPLGERVRVASAAAALKATRPGGQLGSPRWD